MHNGTTLAIGQTRHETDLLTERLAKATVGELVTNDELSRIAGVDVQSHVGRGMLRTARKRAERLLQGQPGGGVFSTVRAVGVRRLAADEQGAEIDLARERIRRQAKRAFVRSRHADWNAMNDAQRAALNATRTVLAFVAKVSTDKRYDRLKGAVLSEGTALTFRKTLGHFRGDAGGDKTSGEQ